MSELKPCPFCPDGGRLEQRTGEATWPPITYKGAKYPSTVRCLECGCWIHGYGKSREEAEIAAQNHWNTRYQPTCHNVSKYNKPKPGTFDVGGHFECSECGFMYGYANLPYDHCPGCGTKVVSE